MLTAPFSPQDPQPLWRRAASAQLALLTSGAGAAAAPGGAQQAIRALQASFT